MSLESGVRVFDFLWRRGLDGDLQEIRRYSGLAEGSRVDTAGLGSLRLGQPSREITDWLIRFDGRLCRLWQISRRATVGTLIRSLLISSIWHMALPQKYSPTFTLRSTWAMSKSRTS